MADLPVERLAYQSPPFTNTGVHYFGPLYVTVRKTTEKRWGFLFTCLTTRAVHVEIVPSMDASSCVFGVERLVSRRSTPAIFWSGNGTTSLARKKYYARTSKTCPHRTCPQRYQVKVQPAQCATQRWHLGEAST